MSKHAFWFILKSFIIWRIGITIISFFAVKYVPVFGHNYFGNGYSNYILNPLFWGHFNFDGEHYLAIAKSGYQPLEYFFFPIFPTLMGYFTPLVGLIVSNLFFLLSLFGIYGLVKLDFKDNVARLTLVLFLIFPTSFYFGAYYTESIFLMLVIWSFYFARKGNFFFASVMAAILSATRIIGVIMFPVLIFEFLVQKRKNVLPILISPLGLLIYMNYLFRKTGDSLIFVHQISIFGEQRSSSLVLLPQVIYRYLFKILPALHYNYFPAVFTTYLEFTCGILFLFLIIYSFLKLRLSYAIFALMAYLIPTFSGSFSSMPRYVLVLFPSFILVSVYLNKLPKVYTYIIFSVMLLLLVISETLFWRGYWVS